jgi:hypothetical protein
MLYSPLVIKSFSSLSLPMEKMPYLAMVDSFDSYTEPFVYSGEV